VDIFAVDAARNNILSASSIDGGGATFEPPAGVSVAGFAIALDTGGGYTNWAAGGVITSGTVAATDEDGANITGFLTPGEFYAVDGAGGPWDPGSAYSQTDYLLAVGSNGNFSMVFGRDAVESGAQFLTRIGWGGSAVQIATNYGRGYFQAQAGVTYRVRVGELGGNFSDNIGSMGWVLRSATATPSRYIRLSSARLYNICAP
jgi:hypothetical protein